MYLLTNGSRKCKRKGKRKGKGKGSQRPAADDPNGDGFILQKKGLHGAMGVVQQ